MKFSKEHYIGYIIVIVFFVLFGCTVKFPLFAPESQKHTLFQSTNILELFLILLLLTGVYFFIAYLIPFNKIIKQLKSYREPILKLNQTKFNYWLKSELYEHEIKEQVHLDTIGSHVNTRALSDINVLQKAAELSDMKVETYIKAIRAQAQANLINAQSEMERSKAEILNKAVKIISKMTPMWQAYIISCVTGAKNELTKDPELQKEMDIVVKEKYEQELRKAVLDNDNLEYKYKRNQQPPN